MRGRSLGYTLKAGATVEQQTTYAYDTASRLSTLATQTPAAGAPRTFRYGYLADSDLLNRLTIDDNTAFAVNRSFEDKRDVLTAIETVWGSAVRARFDYVTNGLGQRTSALQSGDAFADNGPATYQTFGYDGRGQLTAAPTYLGTAADDSQKLDGRQYSFEFDNIGNRTSDNRAKNNPEALRNTYTTNALNQYTAKTNKSLAASGTTQDDPALNVAVQAGGKTVKADRLGRIWNAELSALNSNGLNPSGLNTNGPWRDLVTVYTGKAGSPATVQTSVRLAQIAALNQTFAYDLDGNLTFDGLWNYAWDAENRLIRQTTAAGAVAAGVRNIALEYRYDYLGRRVQKLVIDAAANRLIYGRRFLYDGWNLIAEYALNASLSTLTLVRTYTWGLDIARTMSDAGGVGALLQITDHGTGRSFLPAYDGNGNVTALLNSSETTRIVNGVSTTYPAGSVAAAYEYSPFGEQLRADAPDSVVADQPFRFSTKYTDSETGLVYYGQRYYDPAQGRFVGRDPIEEKGGINLYAFVRNRPVNTVDVMGLLGLDDAVVLHADGGGSFDPIIRMNPFVTAVDSEQRIQRALDALAAQSNPFIFAFNAGLGGSGGQKSDEQKKKEEEEKKKKEECEKMMKNLQGKMRQSTALHSDLQDQIKMEQFGELVSTAHMVVSEGLKAGLGTAMSLKLGRVFVAQRAVPWTAMNGARMGGDYATVTNGGLLNEMVRNAGLEVIGDRVVDPLVTGATLGALGAFWNEYGDALESGKDAMAVARQVTDRLQSSYNKLMSDVGKLQDDYQSKCP